MKKEDIKNKNTQNIINNFGKIKENFKESKNKARDLSERCGLQEELAEAGENIWKYYKKYEDLPVEFVDSMEENTEDLLKQSEKIKEIVITSEADEIFSITGASARSAYGVSLSGTVYVTTGKPEFIRWRNRLQDIVKESSQEEEIPQELGAIDISLQNEYDNAWKSLRITTEDKTRGPMLLMREVVNRLLRHFAPDEQVMKFKKIGLRKDITRADRIDYIKNQIDDPLRKEAFLHQERSFKKIFKSLNKAHKEGKLDIEETKGFLYQASGLIKLLLDCFK